MMTLNIKLRRALELAAALVVLTVGILGVQLCDAQTTTADSPKTFAVLSDPATGPVPVAQPAATDGAESKSVASAPDPEISAAVARQLAAMQAEIEALKAELKSRNTPATVEAASPAAVGSSIAPMHAAQEAGPAAPERPKPADPFAYADWTRGRIMCELRVRGEELATVTAYATEQPT
jgi:hypothetical protein